MLITTLDIILIMSTTTTILNTTVIILNSPQDEVDKNVGRWLCSYDFLPM